MALGFDVILIGVFCDNARTLAAWRCDPPWFDGWELARDERMAGDGYPFAAVFPADEVGRMHARYLQQLRKDISNTSTPNEPWIIADNDANSRNPDDPVPPLDELFPLDDYGIQVRPGIPPPATVAELDQLLAAPALRWVLIELWDRS